MSPQICISFSESTYNEVKQRAKEHGVKHSKEASNLVELALTRVEPLEAELRETQEKLGLTLALHKQLQDEIIPPLNLLIEGKPHEVAEFTENEDIKPSFWSRIRRK